MMLKGWLEKVRVPRADGSSGAPAPADASCVAARSAGCTHVGRVRAVNEDRLLDRPDRGLWAVADGMGGHSAGEIAAEVAIDALHGLADDADAIDEETLRRTLAAAHRAVQARTGGRGGTTVVTLRLTDDCATILWAGDSRAYLVRDGEVRLLTRDHSFVQDLVEAGALDARAAARHPKSNVITRAMGFGAVLDLDRLERRVQPGDLIILCTDGLSRSLSTDGVPFDPRQPVAAIARQLIADAVDRDGSDNATALVVRI